MHKVAPQNVKENVSKPQKNVPRNAPKMKEEPAKQEFIEPGTPVHPLESILTTTCMTDDGCRTYYTAKELRGPALKVASQLSMQKQPLRKPKKSVP